MKRKLIRSSTSKSHALDARNLTTVRGGGLGIAVGVLAPSPLFMQQQHNETLIDSNTLTHEVTR